MFCLYVFCCKFLYRAFKCFLGSTFLDEHNESRVAILHWRLAHHLRASRTPYIGMSIIS